MKIERTCVCGELLTQEESIYVCNKCGKKYEVVGSKDVYLSEGIMWSFKRGIRNLALESTEGGLRRLLRDKLKDKSLFLDVGANDGVHAIGLSKDFEKIVAIEPHPINVGLMLDTIRMNNIKNVSIYQMAAWDKPYVLKLNRTFEGSTDGHIFTTEHEIDAKMHEIIDVPGLPLDNLNLSPSCIKIDVEGAELNVLRGLTETMIEHRPVVIVEIHMLFGVVKDDIIDFMRRIGYMNRKALWEDDNTAHYVFCYDGNSIGYFDPYEYNSDMACTFSRELSKDNLYTLEIFKELKTDEQTGT